MIKNDGFIGFPLLVCTGLHTEKPSRMQSVWSIEHTVNRSSKLEDFIAMSLSKAVNFPNLICRILNVRKDFAKINIFDVVSY